MNRRSFWILFLAIAAASAAAAYWYFPRAFSIIALDITMDRGAALARARAIADRDALGPAGYRQAAAFELDSRTQTFVELEGGGKDAFTGMLREGLYAAYAWRVRHFKEGDPHEAVIRFTPDGRPYGFAERLDEAAPGAALEAAEARRIAEEGACARWDLDVTTLALVEQGHERRPGGRVDHTITYERPAPTLNEGRYRLRLGVAGDRLTEVTWFVKIPEAFERRFDSMRSANEAIGVGAAVAMMLVYVVGGIGVGLFVMLRRRWILWRHAAFWGGLIAFLQALTILNRWPLTWMTYDTAVPTATFAAQQVGAALALFVGMGVFFTLSFIAAETLTRRAFGAHPRLWRVWAREPGSSTAVLGRTVAGYLLVPVFLAYEVALYFIATRNLGWWTPAEALFHPDVLATYVPWLDAIANSLQAGFWEECLFRAVPIAGAALIGERLGQRRLFIVLAFVLQAIIFGAGHAPYPAQPSYARPVELLLPSIGFGLLYLYFGLVPAIVLHFAFDVFWFALPLFLAQTPGIIVQQALVVAVTLLPLWVVLWRRAQTGRFIELAPRDLNETWTPPPVSERVAVLPAPRHHDIHPFASRTWLALGAAGLAACVAAIAMLGSPGSLSVTRPQAEAIARRALAERGIAAGPPWRVLPAPQSGGGMAHEFVSRTAGEPRRRELIGTYLPAPHWRVRVARFDGDVAERAEEWVVVVDDPGRVRTVSHTLPQARPGATLDEDAARRLAQEAVGDRTGLGPGDLREVSARPSKLDARTDWSFTFSDTTVAPLPQGEPRVQVTIAGDEVASVARFVYVPEEWRRAERAAATRRQILQGAIAFTIAGLLIGAAIGGIVWWARGRYVPRLFLRILGVMIVAGAIGLANGWPVVLSSLSTAQPMSLQIAIFLGVGAIGLTFSAAFVALATGALPRRLEGGSLPPRDALRYGIALGLVGAGISAGAALLRPDWTRVPAVDPAGAFVPMLGVALQPVTALLTAVAILLTALTAIDRATSGWQRRRIPAVITLALISLAGAGGPAGSGVAAWLAVVAALTVTLVAAYVSVLRADLTIVPVALGVLSAARILAAGAQRPFPGALPGSILGAALALLTAWWCFRMLRRWRLAATPQPASAAAHGGV